ncbi:hypothetical protein MMYC01_205621 [Madurella mycetomatis]|uniref:Tartrate transporter n=1 Tax=Madurella mycetomatis TaxID=100816 RepID=A0A175W692_9PEZI|nr:hypothetical protein MMYC01_205621 [Madurella mycetomatis]
MTGTDFNLATSVFFVGYLVFQLPSNMLITRPGHRFHLQRRDQEFRPTRCGVPLSRFRGGAFLPRRRILISSWYTRAELTQRMAYFYLGNALANMFGGLVGAAVLETWMGLWKWLEEGVITIAVALLAMWVLPDYPNTTRWLYEDERAFASRRLLADINESDDQMSRTVWDGAKLALLDYRLYLFVLLQHLSLLSQTFQYFFPSIVETLGYGDIETLWLTAPAQVSGSFAAHLLADTSGGECSRNGDNCAWSPFFRHVLDAHGGCLDQIILSWVANSFPRPMVKRSVAVAIANMVGNTASIYGSYMYPKESAPQYVPGGTANSAICLGVGLLASTNKRLEDMEKAQAENPEAHLTRQEVDVRAEGFRYIY